MRKERSGKLTEIESITREGNEVVLNGVTVQQGAAIDISGGELNISNSSGTNNWRFPPDLDGSGERSLKFLKIGVGGSGAVSENSIESDNSSVRLKAEGGSVRDKLGSSNIWKNFTGSPTVYVIYNEQASYLKIENRTSRDYDYRLRIENGSHSTYTNDIFRKSGDGTEIIRSTSSGNSSYYQLSIGANSSDIICILNAVGMSYYLQVVDSNGNVISTADYQINGFRLADDSDSERGTLIMGPEFEEASESFEEAETTGLLKRVSYTDEFIPAETLYRNTKEPFMILIILALMLGLSAVFFRVRKQRKQLMKESRLGKEKDYEE